MFEEAVSMPTQTATYFPARFYAGGGVSGMDSPTKKRTGMNIYIYTYQQLGLYIAFIVQSLIIYHMISILLVHTYLTYVGTASNQNFKDTAGDHTCESLPT